MIRVGATQYSVDEAEAAIRWYLAGTWTVNEGIRKDARPAEAPGVFASNSAARLYDPFCSADGLLTPLQIVAANGLNARISTAERAVLVALIPEVNEHLSEIGPATSLFKIEFDGPKAVGASGSAMTAAYKVLRQVKGVAYTKASKILHLVRPELYPVIDTKTMESFSDNQVWVTVRDQIAAQRSAFDHLESVSKTLAADDPTLTPIGSLRIHDILVWCDVTEKRHHWR